MYFFCCYDVGMDKRMGKPPKDPNRKRDLFLQVRVVDAEKRTFQAAAELAGLDVSGWVRERLRDAARRELEAAGLPVPLINQFGKGDA